VRSVLSFAGIFAAGAAAAYCWSYTRRAQQDREDSSGQAAAQAVAQARISEEVFLDVSINGAPAKRIVLGLYGADLPLTTTNFVALCKGDKKANALLSFKDSSFHRVIPGFM
jgi:peptidylprolyl isomerase